MQYHVVPCNNVQYHAITCNTMQYNTILCNTMQYRAISCNTMQYHAIQFNTMHYQAIPCIINNCWRSVPLPFGQYKAIFFVQFVQIFVAKLIQIGQQNIFRSLFITLSDNNRPKGKKWKWQTDSVCLSFPLFLFRSIVVLFMCLSAFLFFCHYIVSFCLSSS